MTDTPVPDTLPKAYNIKGGPMSGKSLSLRILARKWLNLDPQNAVVRLDFECLNPWDEPQERCLQIFCTRLDEINLPSNAQDPSKVLILADLPQLGQASLNGPSARHWCKSLAQRTGCNVVYTSQTRQPPKGDFTTQEGELALSYHITREGDNVTVGVDPYEESPVTKLIQSLYPLSIFKSYANFGGLMS